MLELISFMVLALVLGFKHSYDADHIIAVSNILRKIKTISSALKIGFSWAIGHMITATIITILLFIFRKSALNFILPHFEKIVGFMLIFLGILSLKDIFLLHKHKHKHGRIVHSHIHLHYNALGQEDYNSHKHMFGIGIIHGLASNDELLILFTTSLGITTIGGIILGIGFFSLGVVLGMTIFCAILSLTFLKIHREKIHKIFSLLTGSISIIYGTLMIFQLI